MKCAIFVDGGATCKRYYNIPPPSIIYKPSQKPRNLRRVARKIASTFANKDGSVLSSYSLREDRTHELMTDNLHFVFVELNNFNKKWEDIDNDKERFYFCIRHMHELKDLPDGFAQGIWAKLAQQSEFAKGCDCQ